MRNKVKKFLKKQAQKDLSALETDDDRGFLQRMKDLVVKQNSATQKDYCLTCRLPVSKCKGECTPEERKRNGS